jgi:hypothetical protein
MRKFGIVAVMALLAGPAWGQAAVPKYGDPDKEKSASDIAAEKAAERAYQRSLGNIPEQKSTDPWGAVRSDNAAPKAAAKAPGKPKAAKSEAAKSEAAKSEAAKSDAPAKQQ